MARLLSFLIMLALALNGPAVAAAVCHHSGAQAHVLALQSSDRTIATEALQEERAAAVALQKGALERAAAMQLAPFVLPEAPVLFVPRIAKDAGGYAIASRKLTGRAIRPLLEPPEA